MKHKKKVSTWLITARTLTTSRILLPEAQRFNSGHRKVPFF